MAVVGRRRWEPSSAALLRRVTGAARHAAGTGACLTRVALLLLIAGCPAVSAHLPEYFGRKFVLVPVDRPAPAMVDACGGDRAEMRRQAAILDERLETLQRERGAYAPSLADPAGELGKLYAGLCDHPAALDAFRRTIQVQRINEGLLTQTQLPSLRSLADSSQAIGDFESAQLTLRYALRIHGMGVGELSPTALRDALHYFERARQLFIDPRSPGALDLFFQAYEDNLAMFDAQLARTRAGQGTAYANLKAIALSHLYNLYLILGTDLSSARYAEADSAGWEFMQRMQLLTYSRGIDVIEALLEQPEAATGAERARLLLRLGNWQQWNDKTTSACESYARAWALATEASSGVLLGQLAQPAELPEDPALWNYLLGPAIPVRAVVEADFRVSRRGHISGVKGGAVDADRGAVGGRVIRWLRDSHARPAVREGACVDGELTGRRYHLVD
jgi:hypothetical protein